MEQVLVISRKAIKGIDNMKGFTQFEETEDLSGYSNAFFMNRDAAEYDPTYKQIIPAIVIMNEDNEIFLTQRLKTQTEARLHGKHSINVGGHINPIDKEEIDTFSNIIIAGFNRELNEEMEIEGEYNYSIIGTVNYDNPDNPDDVSNVHLGIVFCIVVPNNTIVKVRETDKMTGSFVTIEEAAKHYDNMETWAQYIFTYIRSL